LVQDCSDGVECFDYPASHPTPLLKPPHSQWPATQQIAKRQSSVHKHKRERHRWIACSERSKQHAKNMDSSAPAVTSFKAAALPQQPQQQQQLARGQQQQHLQQQLRPVIAKLQKQQCQQQQLLKQQQQHTVCAL
jgi:DNA replication protein DnaC